MSFITPESKCPKCSTRLNAVSGLGHKFAPQAGDISVCIGCASILVFRQDLSVGLADESDLSDLEPVERENLDICVRAAKRLVSHCKSAKCTAIMGCWCGCEQCVAAGGPRVMKPGESFTVTFPTPTMPCHYWCGEDLRGKRVALVEPHVTDDGQTAYFMSCLECASARGFLTSSEFMTSDESDGWLPAPDWRGS